MQEVFDGRYKSALTAVEDMLKTSTVTYNNLGNELESYCNFIINQLFSEGYLSFDRINTSDEMYVNWKNGTVATKEYLLYTISSGWLDITKFPADTTYSDANEIYDRLTEHIMDSICTTVAFKKLVYKVLVKTGQVSGNALCLILYEQDVLPADDPDRAALEGGAINAFDFMVRKITKLEITPGMLALDPCSASIVITDPSNGNTLACVSYPGYDNNKLANKLIISITTSCPRVSPTPCITMPPRSVRLQDLPLRWLRLRQVFQKEL